MSCCLRSLRLDHALVGRDGEKVTLGSFLFRDDCHALLLRLVTVSSSISKIHGASPAAATGAISRASLEGNFVASDEQPVGDARPEPSESAPGTAISRVLAVASQPCDNFETMVEAVLPCTTAQVSNESVSRMLWFPASVAFCRLCLNLLNSGLLRLSSPCDEIPPAICGIGDNPFTLDRSRARCSLGCGDDVRRFGRISCVLREKPALRLRIGDRRQCRQTLEGG